MLSKARDAISEETSMLASALCFDWTYQASPECTSYNSVVGASMEWPPFGPPLTP